MPCINVREGNGLVSVITLDSCGAPVTGSSSLLQLEKISEVTFEDQITEGDEVNEDNFGGRKKYSDTGCDEITSITVGLTSLGIIPALDAALLASTSKVDGESNVAGFGRLDLNCAQNVAIEVLLQLDTDSCLTDGTAAPVAGWLFPLVKNWRPGGGTTLNGSDLVKPVFNGRGYQNYRIFGGDTPEVVAPLDKWDGIHVPPTAQGESDGEWYTFYLFDGDDVTIPDPSCEPLELAVASS